MLPYQVNNDICSFRSFRKPHWPMMDKLVFCKLFASQMRIVVVNSQRCSGWTSARNGISCMWTGQVKRSKGATSDGWPNSNPGASSLSQKRESSNLGHMPSSRETVHDRLMNIIKTAKAWHQINNDMRAKCRRMTWMQSFGLCWWWTDIEIVSGRGTSRPLDF